MLKVMPSKNVLKEYEAGGYYHLYNRGVNKRLIFKDQQDYSTFLSYLQFYLSPPPNSPDQINLQGESLKVLKVSPSRRLKNYKHEIELLAYCLMPNHFHLMLRQMTDHGIDHFMRSISTKYVRYFNTRYNRLGPLFQGPYKAVKVENEYQFTYLTKYIHRNPLSLSTFKDSPRRLSQYKYSSYANYLHLFKQSWVSTEDILSYFAKTNRRLSYQNFVEEGESDDITIISKLTLDLD
jgi:putative transposase